MSYGDVAILRKEGDALKWRSGNRLPGEKSNRATKGTKG
jgi:hypothetical protein